MMVNELNGSSPYKKVFYKTADGLHLPMFVYMPEVKKKFYDAVITIHGGGWHSGIQNNDEWNGNMMSRHAAYYANHGLLGISFSYRSIDLPNVELSDIVSDCTDALEYIAAEFPFIDKKIVLGDSAGGHLAVSMGISENDRVRPYAVVACNPVLDCVNKFTYAAENERDRIQLSPLWMNIKNASKSLFIHGDADAVTDIRDTIRMCDKLGNAGFEAELITLKGVGHAFILFDYKSTDSQVDSYLDMINRYLNRIGIHVG